jgi:glucose-6-phosphate isomerase/transaldolase/glucose-6-phosphate isomerase
LAGDDNGAADGFTASLAEAGQPLVRFELKDQYDLAGEFFRWELATALAGVALEVQPFDQPNVEDAKRRTKEVLRAVVEGGALPELAATGTLGDLINAAQPGDFLAIMAYLDGSEAIEAALQGLRRRILRDHQLANTMGYGPRFLHSTGQLHKGGPNNGLFLQLVADYSDDLPVPGEGYTFGGLVSAQAAGDYAALEHVGRRVIRLNLGRNVAAELERLLSGE